MMIEVDENDDLDEFIEDVLDEFYLWVMIVDPLSATTHWRGRADRGRQHHLKKVTLKDRQRYNATGQPVGPKMNYRVASWPGQADVRPGEVEVEVEVVRPPVVQLGLQVVPGAKGVVEIFAPGAI